MVRLVLYVGGLWAVASVWLQYTGQEEMMWAAALPALFIAGLIWLVS